MSIIDKITGRAKKAAGDLAGDASLRREGAREERKGEAKDQLDNAQDKVERQGRRGRGPRAQDLSDAQLERFDRAAPAALRHAGSPARVPANSSRTPITRAERDRRFFEAEEAEPVDDDRHRELAGNGRGRHAAGAERADGEQHRRHVGGAEHSADQVVPAHVGRPRETCRASPLTTHDAEQQDRADDERDRGRRQRAGHLARARS